MGTQVASGVVSVEGVATSKVANVAGVSLRLFLEGRKLMRLELGRG